MMKAPAFLCVEIAHKTRAMRSGSSVVKMRPVGWETKTRMWMLYEILIILLVGFVYGTALRVLAYTVLNIGGRS